MREILGALVKHIDGNAYGLAGRSGIPQPTIQRFLNRTHKTLNTETVQKAAAAYGITESQLRGDQALPEELAKALGIRGSVARQTLPSQIQRSRFYEVEKDLEDIAKVYEGEADEFMAQIHARAEKARRAIERIRGAPDTPKRRTGTR